MKAKNHLIGFQIGSQLFYDVGYRLSYSFLSKVGGYANIGNMKTQLYNGGFQFLNNDSDDASLAGVLELGLQSHYQLRPHARFRLGYNMLWMWGVYTIEDNFPRVLSPATGTDPRTNGGAELLHGVNFGFEFYR